MTHHTCRYRVSIQHCEIKPDNEKVAMSCHKKKHKESGIVQHYNAM